MLSLCSLARSEPRTQTPPPFGPKTNSTPVCAIITPNFPLNLVPSFSNLLPHLFEGAFEISVSSLVRRSNWLRQSRRHIRPVWCWVKQGDSLNRLVRVVVWRIKSRGHNEDRLPPVRSPSRGHRQQLEPRRLGSGKGKSGGLGQLGLACSPRAGIYW